MDNTSAEIRKRTMSLLCLGVVFFGLLVPDCEDHPKIDNTSPELFVPKASIFDSVIMKKTTVMFRMLNCDWTSLNPHRTDYAPYRGSNLEEEDFHGGKSVVFAVPSERLREKVKDVDVQINVRKEVSKYFEMEACQNVGTAMVNVDDLFNGIVKELRERRELNEYLSGFHMRQPISRSLKGTYKIVNSEEGATGATITVYVRLSHLGKSVVTEIELGGGKRRDFYAQEESNESHPYGCKELKPWQLESGCWGGSKLILPPAKGQLSCRCDSWARMTKPADQVEESEDEAPRDRLDDCDGRGGAGEEPRGSRDNGNGSGRKDPKRKKVSKSDSARGSISRSPTGGGKKRSTSRESPRPSQAENKVNKGKERRSVKRGSEVSKADGHRGLSAGVPVDRGDYPRPSKVPASAKKPRATEAAERTDKGGEKTVNSKDQRIQDRSKAKSADAASNRRLQLRRRQHGVITVGLGDRDKKICHEAPEARSTSPSTCPCVLQTSTSIQPTVCSNVYSRYCCPTISSCKSNCSPRTSITRNSTMYGCFVQPSPTLVPEMTIYTN